MKVDRKETLRYLGYGRQEADGQTLQLLEEGIAGTIQAYVPDGLLENYRETLESVYGKGSCHILQIRPAGMCEITAQLGR